VIPGAGGFRGGLGGSSPRENLRELLGLAPDGKLRLLESLLAGACDLEDLVAASALPRRDVEEFTAALGLGDPASGADRTAYRTLLAEYRASRARVRPEDEADLERAAADLVAGVPAPRKRLDHVQATPGTLVRRAAWLTERFDLSGRSVLFAGDHDLTSLLLARVVPDAELTVADIDEDLLAYIDETSGSAVRCAWADFRFGLPPALAQSADVVFTDPPYTPEGLGLFLTRSLQALRRDEPAARIVIAYGHSRRRPDLGVAAQREIVRQDVAIDALLPAFSGYDGAQAVGSVSDLYSCQPTARAFRRLDQGGQHGSHAQGIYTHGEQSVESSPRSAAGVADLLPALGLPTPATPATPGTSVTLGTLGLISAEHAPGGGFAVTAGLGKLLEDGLHPSVTGRAGEFVVDLRDDPGPWLLRAMLALNAPRATFVVNARHDALTPLAAEAPGWLLPRAKYETVHLDRPRDTALAAVRCTLAPDPPVAPAAGTTADPGLELARFVTRRAHGKLRNVWREGLIALAARNGTTLTKRAAADLADQAATAAGRRNDLALRLIDVPATHFPALHTALRASAEAVSG
jgi:branched-chain polyamine synthase A-like protein